MKFQRTASVAIAIAILIQNRDQNDQKSQMFKTTLKPKAISSSTWPKSSLEPSIVLGLLLRCLEPTMAELGGCVNELELNLLQCKPRRLLQQGLPQGHNTLLRSNTAALDQQVIFVDYTIVGEASHWGDILLRPAYTIITII